MLRQSLISMRRRGWSDATAAKLSSCCKADQTAHSSFDQAVLLLMRYPSCEYQSWFCHIAQMFFFIETTMTTSILTDISQMSLETTVFLLTCVIIFSPFMILQFVSVKLVISASFGRHCHLYVCFFVSRMTQKVIGGFSWNLGIGRLWTRDGYILEVIRNVFRVFCHIYR